MAVDYQFLITQGAIADFHACREADARAAATLALMIRELKDDAAFLECMIDEDYSDGVVKDVMALVSLQSKRIDAYRVKLVHHSQWRLIWVHDQRTARIGLFSIMPRSADYENDPVLWARIEREFNEHIFTHR
ncbi:hypothetical protein FHW96_000267 [Novosphingobium sp. SG751A]|uniref:hypothetical protein n=1 Tax=Novosphingobium sp. SG751A TaxID=2587000 RepID=UPI001557AABA|nr:hypothetical protein [Novosphingobium sp. SG751A]NOW44140.1 hypothetical protein [Novosphingobium sp. SG751A]